MKLVIIDSSEVIFNGNTLNVRGLGGSESAIILLSKELSKIGFEVTVINNCKSDTCISGIFDNVTYIDKSDINSITDKFEIVISSRSVIPFISKEYFFTDNSYKVVWLHDTFCEGDHLLETLLIDNVINEIFTLSDFHTNYILNANHGSPRMFEVLKNKVFQTRNGAVKYKTHLAKDKSKNKFVFNAAVSKGLVPLLNDIWPKVFKKIPTAKLTVIGGYYLLKNNVLDEQGKLVKELQKNRDYAKCNIQFQDILKPLDVANHISQAGFMIYPAAYPETFGISSLESLLYKTPIITCRFGALEETAIENACYLLNYPIEPNSLFPNINKDEQIDKFVDLVINAYNDDYLYKQKQEYCSIIEDVYSWNTIALQWKQHLYYKLGYFLSKEEFHQVNKINNDVARIFSRRNKNLVELQNYPKYSSEKSIVIITPVYNAEEYISRCIESVITQDYSNYKMFIIDDNSTDSTKAIINYYLPNDTIILIENNENKGALYNQVTTIVDYCSDDDIIILLDGDDCFTNNNSILNYYNELHNDYDFSYGSCWSEIDNIPLIAQEYPSEIIETKQYKNHLFAWNIPYTHLRTFKKFLLNNVNLENFQNNGEWLRAGGDVALFYELIYQTNGDRIKAVKDIMSYYNDKNVLNDYKINSEEQTNNVQNILSKKDLIPVIKDIEAKFSVIIPTMWKYKPFCKFLEKLVTVELVEEIIIINNDVKNTPEENVLNHEKIKLHNFSENIYVNPAWNYGVANSINNKLAFINDDIEYDLRIFERVYPYLISENGAIGLLFEDYISNDIIVEPYNSGALYGFGFLFFVHKNNWVNIPNDLKVEYGDTFVIDMDIINHKQLYLIKNIDFYTPCATTRAYIDNGEINYPELKNEADIYQNLILNYEQNYNRNRIKTILIAIPTDKYIHSETFKSIYDLEIPNGYKIDFQYFYGYRIDQVRNLIADWGKKYDYLFAVDSDIIFPKDTLKLLLTANKDIISGLYIQRIENTHNLELYGDNGRIKYDDIKDKGVIEVSGCGFGCVLINSRVLKHMEYPHFLYTHAIDHKDTYSEDYYFCTKAKSIGFKIFADTSILCNHVGETTFTVE